MSDYQLQHFSRHQNTEVTRRGRASSLNAALQEALNPGDKCLRRSGLVFRKADKVIQIRNNYDKEVFNGDIGIITALNVEDRELTVDFDGRAVAYDVTELDELVQAYAITIHKAQGSEIPSSSCRS
jgi:exodeoxyribonuclease V alpha subunit